MFSPRISQRSLVTLCRSLATMLGAGIDVRKAFALARKKTHDGRLRRALETIATDIERGDSISESMRRQEGVFPDLLIDMTSVAEQTGSVPEIYEHLAQHYDNNVRLKKHLIGMIAWPVFQFVAAVFVIALLILILGMLPSPGGEPIDVLGLGLTGVGGAVTWLLSVFGTVFALFIVYKVLSRSFQGKRSLHSLAMRIPVLGHCMRSFAIARFSWAFYLTQQSGMPIQDSLTTSLDATANGVFQSAARPMCAMIEAGEDLSTALASSRIFPEEFLEMVMVAETSGTVPEALHRLSPQFEEDARRSLTALAKAIGVAVWVTVAAFIIVLVFRIFLWYAGMLGEAINETNRV